MIISPNQSYMAFILISYSWSLSGTFEFFVTSVYCQNHEHNIVVNPSKNPIIICIVDPIQCVEFLVLNILYFLCTDIVSPCSSQSCKIVFTKTPHCSVRCKVVIHCDDVLPVTSLWNLFNDLRYTFNNRPFFLSLNPESMK